MELVGVEFQTLVSEPDALTTRPPPCASISKSCLGSISWSAALAIESSPM